MVDLSTFLSLQILDLDYSVSIALKEHLNTWLDASPPHEKLSRYKVAHLILSSAHNRQATLSIEGYGISSLPAGLEELHFLEEIRLNQNELKELSIDFGRLANLKKVSLSHNRLTSLPDSFYELALLEELDLSHNQFEKLSEAFIFFTHLESLNVESNLLANLPSSICSLQNLLRLKLANNRLKILPSEIGQLYELREISLQKNLLTSLPDSLTELTKLNFLNLSQNLIRFLPVHIGKMSLKTLSIKGNPISQIPISFLFNPNIQHIEALNTSLPSDMLTCLDAIPSKEKLRFTRTLKTCLRFLSHWTQNTPPKGEPYTLMEARMLNQWIEHLSSSEDFAQNQVLLAETIFSLLCEAEKNREFRDVFFLQLQHNTHRCGDRAAYTLILLNALKEIYQKSSLAPKERFGILLAASRTLYLQKIVRKLLIPSEGISEDVEIQLFVMLMLKDRLKLLLPIDSIQMTYKDLAQQMLGGDVDTQLEKIAAEIEDKDPFELVLSELPQIIETFLEEFYQHELTLIRDAFEEKFFEHLEQSASDPLLQETIAVDSSVWFVQQKKDLLMRNLLPF